MSSVSAYIQLAWLFRSKQVFLELAVPTMLESLEEDIVGFRKHLQGYFNENLKTDAVFHPTKWGRIW